LRIERLVDGGEHSASQQARDQILGTDLEFLGQILNADPLGNGDVPSDRQRLIRKRQPRRRNKALHWAFLHPARNIALTWSAGWPTRSTLCSSRDRKSTRLNSSH